MLSFQVIILELSFTQTLFILSSMMEETLKNEEKKHKTEFSYTT